MELEIHTRPCRLCGRAKPSVGVSLERYVPSYVPTLTLTLTLTRERG